MSSPTVVHELALTVWDENGYTGKDTTEVDTICGAAQPDQQLDPEPPVNRLMSPPGWRAREEDYLKGEVHGIASARRARG